MKEEDNWRVNVLKELKQIDATDHRNLLSEIEIKEMIEYIACS